MASVTEGGVLFPSAIGLGIRNKLIGQNPLCTVPAPSVFRHVPSALRRMFSKRLGENIARLFSRRPRGSSPSWRQSQRAKALKIFPNKPVLHERRESFRQDFSSSCAIGNPCRRGEDFLKEIAVLPPRPRTSTKSRRLLFATATRARQSLASRQKQVDDAADILLA